MLSSCCWTSNHSRLLLVANLSRLLLVANVSRLLLVANASGLLLVANASRLLLLVVEPNTLGVLAAAFLRENSLLFGVAQIWSICGGQSLDHHQERV